MLRGRLPLRSSLFAALFGLIATVACAQDRMESTAGEAASQEDKPPIEERLPGVRHGPPSKIDLSMWKITLPVNEAGEVSGEHDAVELYRLTGLSVPPWFEAARNSIAFTVPVEGAMTRGTKYPRSELREMDGAGHEYAWTVADAGRFSARVQVDELPDTSLDASDTSGDDANDDDSDKNETDKPKDARPARVVIGQIHGPKDELCRLYYSQDGSLFFVDDKAGEDREETVFKLTAKDGSEPDIPLGKPFTYTIDANAERLQVRVRYKGIEYAGSDPIGPFWPGKALYFKAGAYLQVTRPGAKAGTIGTGRARVTFLALSRPAHDVVHPYRDDRDQD
ncbi:polysaccharide lyase family 7 protein [Novosphingobium sp. 9]|uniref:polysaccharide lyase family 7 protein n=1 Tax=Novosphingobium sp. 9 TaxID=2025349 RepID=UPI0021B5F004|nr:polysaccharide lyase family 7 protein [Novosphingobium sp. 9]